MSDFGEDFMLCEDEEDYGLVITFFIKSQHVIFFFREHKKFQQIFNFLIKLPKKLFYIYH